VCPGPGRAKPADPVTDRTDRSVAQAGLGAVASGNTGRMDQPTPPGGDLWYEAVAGVQASLDADLRAEAYEVFVAEAARCRLVDRAGAATVLLRCGVVLEGELTPHSDDGVAEHLVLRGTGDVSRLVAVCAVVSVRGSGPGLRPEGDGAARSLTSWLREAWSADESMSLIVGSGARVVGRLGFVGADHVEIWDGDARTVVPLASVEAWQRG
jgi:hypothetical protein